MHRYAVAIFAALLLAVSAPSDLAACGDKFLRAGRSARAKNYAAIHKATILIYKPNADPAGLKKWENSLKKAGHKPLAITSGAALPNAMAATRYDLVIADLADAETVKAQFSAGAEQPAFLPILHKPTASAKAAAVKAYHCVIVPEEMTPYDALGEIDHAMEMRSKQGRSAAH